MTNLETDLLFKNQALTIERKRLRVALADLLSGWRYIRQTHGDLYGVGWDRAQTKAEEALGLGSLDPLPKELFDDA
jgi:hypothetical protein